MHITNQKLQNLLVTSGVVNEKTFTLASEESLRSGQFITDVLIGRGDITEDYLMEVLEPYFGAPVINLKNVPIPSEVLELVPETYAKAKGIAIFEYSNPVRDRPADSASAAASAKEAGTATAASGRPVSNGAKEQGTLKVAMLDPLDYDTIEFLRAKFQVWVEPYLTTPTSLKFAHKQYKRKIGVEFNEIISENVKKFLSVSGETDMSKLAEAVPVVTILDSIIDHAMVLNASDIHFEPLQGEVLVRYRVDGILHEILTLHKIIEPILVARVKILANLQIDEHRVPQDGRFRFEAEEGGVIDIRVNVMPIMHGEKVEMRLLKSSTRPLTLEELGVSSEATSTITEEMKKPHGMILVTGPTGHGKTTTLYAILHMLNTPDVNITTIEDPIEYEIPRVNQTQVNVKAGITFANGLRSILRQNPDIIMVGEIRDNETVEISVHAALTGHLVLSSLHTNDAPAALPRLLDMGAPAFLLASTINLVIAQRLVRRICTSCVSSYKITAEIKRLITAQLTLVGDNHIKNIPESLFRGKGCNVCGNTGFQGQVGIFEILRVTEPIRNLLIGKETVGQIRSQAIKDGMVTMFEDGLQKIEKGVTTIEEVLRVVQE